MVVYLLVPNVSVRISLSSARDLPWLAQLAALHSARFEDDFDVEWRGKRLEFDVYFDVRESIKDMEKLERATRFARILREYDIRIIDEIYEGNDSDNPENGWYCADLESNGRPVPMDRAEYYAAMRGQPTS